ncbi:unnamed protein product [Sphagnum troendelagicum]|uniref:Folate-biopterin transporter n=1 Tax=Sphagnum troendelagicum TaxID=128251 RepID=A0ABP0UHA2_9BRYO
MVVIVLGYCTQGFRCFPWLAMSYFFKDDLQVDPGTMQLLMSTANLPMVAKPIYGIISDSVYIKGAHRIPYLAFAGALQLLSWGLISLHADDTSSVGVMTGILTITNMGAAISEVVNDALVAEAGKNKEGELQSFAWLALATGGLLGNLTGGFALQNITSQSMFSIFMVLVGAQLLLCLSVSEVSFNLGLPEDTEPAVSQKDLDNVLREKNTLSSMHQQVMLLKGLLQKPEILRPLLWFLSSSAIIPGLGSSMFFYQTQHLRLDPSVIGLAKVVGQLGLLAGSIYYNRFLKKVPLRKLFGSVQILWGLCMLSDILLVNQINVEFGIPDEYFVLGASAFVEAIAQFKILPFMVLLAQLCPSGSEGSLFAFFMSAQCLAGMMSAYLGVGLASYLHISSGSFDELPQGIFIEAMFTMLPVLWINFIPEDFKEFEASTQASQHEQQVR